MPALIDLLLEGRRVAAHGGWPRVRVEPAIWRFAAEQLGTGHWTLLGLWGEAGERLAVHLALLDETQPGAAVVSLDCPDGRFPSVGQYHAPALRLERALHELTGLEPEGLPDRRPWLDHGRWDRRFPLGAPGPAREEAPYAFLQAEGEQLHQIAVGPVHAGIIEPGQFRFTAAGETVVRLEERLGYVHRGVESLMAGTDLARAAQLAGRVSGDSTVACALAFAQAAEAALGLEVPPRARRLRVLMAELERLANHLGDIGAVCNDAAFALLHSHCGVLRERVLRAADGAFGHRLLRDRIVPGGVAADLGADGRAALAALVAEVRRRFPRLVTLFDETPSLRDRTVGTGIVAPALARRFGAGGFVGRASGRGFDARRLPGQTLYEGLAFEVPVLETGDVDARVWIRIREVEQSLALIEQILAALPDGPLAARIEPAGEAREGVSLVEGFRGDLLAWLRLDAEGRVVRCHLRDPSWFQWPLLEAAIEGNIVADFPLCNKSFNCSYAGHDL
ncbi:Ni,Fe-hydrogenase III large subunit [Tistlia consotensis]|uniref:Ni,Fe-hydrogenase III large subunit n=1 Tax=Tistlia consotensis USBA 355 TaxID=560819 RepID=A0A1Y6CEC2_9PROT|nr:nickel-dependent hydrogenase large subunit [Tistlia consotensis]SMF58744.1 Ni,Fe-hydrogenase III large subunit [Tistlia consotensis USBA 355]SNR63821.1 Ni,Fe-hydrogenase III large subunit [Tistlia consotensis]